MPAILTGGSSFMVRLIVSDDWEPKVWPQHFPGMSETQSIKPPHVLERAFELASSGQCRSKKEVAQALSKEGYTMDDLSHLSGRLISEQIVDLLTKAPSIH